MNPLLSGTAGRFTRSPPSWYGLAPKHHNSLVKQLYWVLNSQTHSGKVLFECTADDSQNKAVSEQVLPKGAYAHPDRDMGGWCLTLSLNPQVQHCVVLCNNFLSFCLFACPFVFLFVSYCTCR